ncbi:DUF1499 domain-containing protein [Amphritea sp. 2_MG-2023]|uniref:DUF1499 domain-containing protein n=1 Tax=Amphritea TaxID=515417 RepID=UPI001C067BB9|nr:MULTISPECIES: DUF1499 domain-containing protein [Amphritea]MBU2966627.1 DUF1499 domain-containing protein [Amphritea atlantica]MDO6417514.1 DUF1499 domain-containing protein [Amphritea sp. 2_MG-2023]
MKQYMMISGVIVLVAMAIVTGYFALQGMKSREQTPPGLVNGALTVCPVKPNAVCSSAQTDKAHYIAPLHGADLTSVAIIIERLGGRIISQDSDYLAAEFSSSLFGFVDDLELLLDRSAAVIHVRAASRVGYSDMGVNRQRVEMLRQRLEQQQ